jgi:hypothetical protein
MSTQRSAPIDPGLAAGLLLASAAVLWSAPLPDALRVPLVAGYLLLAPGYALVPFFGTEHWLLHGLLALSFSAALAIGLANTMAEAAWWRPELALRATVLAVTVVVLVRMWRDRAALRVLTGETA